MMWWNLLCGFLVFGASFALAQSEPQTATLSVSDIETEITYDRIVVTYNAWGCEAINWSYKADWKDGFVTGPSGDITRSHINDKGYRLRDVGTNIVWFTHSYQTPNSNPGYAIDFFDQGQCAGHVYPDGLFTHKSTQMLRVWRRVPVLSLSVSPTTAKVGSQVSFTVTLDGAAPPSSTMILTDFPSDLFVGLPQNLFVPSTLKTVTATLTLSGSVRPGNYVLKAWTAESQKTNPPQVTLQVIK
jgi:hypothetical protein